MMTHGLRVSYIFIIFEIMANCVFWLHFFQIFIVGLKVGAVGRGLY